MQNTTQNTTQNLYQPIETKFVPTPQKKEAIDLKKFLELLKGEENYYKGEQHDTKIMVTRLRKIFYDIYGWNKELIRGAADIPGRYAVKLVEDKEASYPTKTSGGIKHKKAFEVEHKSRLVTVKEGDWMNPNVGSVPEIYANNNQEVILPDGLYCDLGHVLAGMDAYNYPEPVAPLPNWLMWMHKILPHVDNNMCCATLLGDISSSAGEFIFQKLKEHRDISDEEMQSLIDVFASGTDMLGNIDSFVISNVYNISTIKGLRVSEIFNDYYNEGGMGNYFMKRRYSYFCSVVGLKGWDGENFSNEKKWLKYNKRELRSTTAFYVFTRFEKPASIWLAFKAWIRCYEKVLKLDLLLDIFLKALKELIKQEPKNNQ